MSETNLGFAELIESSLKLLGYSHSHWQALKSSGTSTPVHKPGAAPHNLASYIDHTLLKPDATESAIATLCQEAIDNKFASVCVNSCNVAQCASTLASQPVAVCSVVGFPLGAGTSAAKAAETSDVLALGGNEIDMVLNIGKLKSGKLNEVGNDIAAVVQAALGHPVKVILETGFLSDSEIVTASLLSLNAGATFVKTSTGFGPGGACENHIRLMRSVVGDTKGVKASGGVRDRETVLAMIAAGANRIGTSSGLAIVTGTSGTSGY